MMVNACERLRRDLSALFTCEPFDGRVRIRTPYLYPDGDVIDVFYRDDPDGGTVSDLGETVRWLRMQTVSPRRSAKQTAMIEDAALNHGVQFVQGVLQTKVAREDQLADAVTRVSQAALRVSDIWLTFRTRSSQTVADEVMECLEECQIPFERGPRLTGRSGRTWTPDFRTYGARDDAHAIRRPPTCLVYVLSTGNRSTARSMTNAVHTAWFDLSHLARPDAGQHQFVSLFDDATDVWEEEDFRLLGELSTIARWSNPDEFRAILTAAA